MSKQKRRKYTEEFRQDAEAVVIDLFSRKVAGWSINKRIVTDLVIKLWRFGEDNPLQGFSIIWIVAVNIPAMPTGMS